MIGWKVNVGYSTTELPSLLSSVTWLDTNRIFSIATINKELTYKTVINNESGEEPYNYIFSQLGDELNAWYNLPPCYVGYNWIFNDYVKSYIPSLEKSYPNSYAYYNNQSYGTKVTWVYHFVSLKRVVFIKRNNSIDLYRVGRVNDDNTISYFGNDYKSSGGPNLISYYRSRSGGGQFGAHLPTIPNYNENTDLTQVNIYKSVNFGYNFEQTVGSSYYFSSITDYSNLTDESDLLKYLFGENQKPDVNAPLYSNDPYKEGGETKPGGGTGDFSGDGDAIDIPELPAISTVSTGFITLFNPSMAELTDLANYMWSDLFDINSLRKLFANPMDAILGMSIVPVDVPTIGTSIVTVGNISTGISMTKAASQFVTVDCGTLNVQEYWGAYLDYDPYTKAEIYLPYIGTHPIAVDDIMGKAVHVVYHVDILSGACCAYVKCNDSVLYTFVGQCSCSIPITGNDWTNVINGALSIATAIGTMVATGGASAPLVSGIASTAINSTKPNIEKSGSLGGMGGMMGIQTPYLILTRPRQAVPIDQNVFMGYPSFITNKLSVLSGYTEIESIHLENIPATEQEISEIETLLKNGVIL